MKKQSKARLLVVDDDRNLLKIITMRLESFDYEVIAANSDQEARKLLKNQPFDLALVDLQLEDGNGIILMEDLHQLYPDIPVVILTAFGSIETAVDAMRRGAYNYLTKPFDARELAINIERALQNHQMSCEIKRLKGLLLRHQEDEQIIARSKSMRKVLETVSHIADNDSTIYLHGESGTGKEVIARAIHSASRRHNKSFVAINCAALPESLLESELFGHEKGAFTGAVKSSKGLFAEADGGTIMLDEIGDMPLAIQAKFLRVLQERQFYPVGSQQPKTVDLRVIVATHRNLTELVQEGSFREDLFYRVNVIPLVLPPLRERKDDIPLLAKAFLRKFSARMQKNVKGFTVAAMQSLLQYNWPGNVRELENVVEYAVAMTRQETISAGHILPAKNGDVSSVIKPYKQAREQFEKDYLTRLLETTGGNITAAATLADKYRADIYNLLKKHNIDVVDFKN